MVKSFSGKLINSVLFGSLLLPSLFSSVASRGRSISACVKGGVTDCKHWFWVKLTLITSTSTFTIAVDVVMQFGKRHETTDKTDLLRTCYSLSTLSKKSATATVAEFRRFLRQSHFCETISLLWDSLTFVRQSPVSATVWTGLYGITCRLCCRLVTDLLTTQRGSPQLVMYLLRGNWCNGFWPLLRFVVH